ncbi:MAG: hypothetical protein ACRD3L_00640 [Terriglobales bacterium]
MFKTLPPHSFAGSHDTGPAAQLPQWTYTFTYQNGNTYSDVFVGTDPTKPNPKTTIKVGIIPIVMVYGPNNGNQTFDPRTPYFGNFSTVQMLKQSPIFLSEFDYVQGGTDLGKTQYVDAYQRGNLWEAVQINKGYHIILQPIVAPVQTFNVPTNEGKVMPNPWSGIPVGTADINWFDTQLQSVLQKYQGQITPDILPLFITYNVYLTEGTCCVGGYHTATRGAPDGQTYAYSTSMSQAAVPVFSQDVGALSHEIGEWVLDPFTTNTSPCGIMENGDPLESEANFGDFPYTIQGFTFHPQDLVFLDYFGAPVIQVNGWHTFQNETNANGVCSRGSN